MFKPIDISKTGIATSIANKIQKIFSFFPEINQVILYGSRAKGNYRNGSDIDLCLVGSNLTGAIILKIHSRLDELNLPYSFDISIYDKIDNPKFKDHIDRVGVVFYP